MPEVYTTAFMHSCNAWKQWLSVSRALTKADGESATAYKTAQAFPNLLASRSGNTCITILASRGLGPINGCCREKRLCLIGSVVPSLRPLFACLQKVQGLMLDDNAVFTFLKMKSFFCLKQRVPLDRQDQNNGIFFDF